MKPYDPREKRVLLVSDKSLFDLSTITLSDIEKALGILGLRIVDDAQQDSLRSFVLSESSLFIAPDTLVAVTCGDAAPELLLQQMKSLVPAEAVRLLQVEQRFWPYSGLEAPVQSSVDLALPQLRTRGEGIEDVLRIDSGMQLEKALSWGSTRLLVSGSLPDTKVAETIRRLKEFFSTIMPEALTQEHFFSPTGYSMNAALPSMFGCAHLTPGTEAYLSVEVTSIPECDRWEAFEQFCASLGVREAWLIAEDTGSITLHQQRKTRDGVHFVVNL